MCFLLLSSVCIRSCLHHPLPSFLMSLFLSTQDIIRLHESDGAMTGPISTTSTKQNPCHVSCSTRTTEAYCIAGRDDDRASSCPSSTWKMMCLEPVHIARQKPPSRLDRVRIGFDIWCLRDTSVSQVRSLIIEFQGIWLLQLKVTRKPLDLI